MEYLSLSIKGYMLNDTYCYSKDYINGNHNGGTSLHNKIN